MIFITSYVLDMVDLHLEVSLVIPKWFLFHYLFSFFWYNFIIAKNLINKLDNCTHIITGKQSFWIDYKYLMYRGQPKTYLIYFIVVLKITSRNIKRPTSIKSKTLLLLFNVKLSLKSDENTGQRSSWLPNAVTYTVFTFDHTNCDQERINRKSQ